MIDQLSTISLSSTAINNEAYIGNDLQENEIILIPRIDLEAKISLSAQLRPNPMTTSSDLRITSSEVGLASIRIMDISGRLVKQDHTMLVIGNNSVNIDRSDFSQSGLYCILINQGSEQIMQKIVVQ